MKRSFIITIALIAAIAVPLCASSGWARGLGVLGMCGGAAGGATSCSESTDYIGLPTFGGSTLADLTGNRVYIQRFAPVCASGCSGGSFASVNLYHNNETVDLAKVCVYEDDGDNSPGAGDLMVGCSEHASSAVEDDIATITGGASCAEIYWIAIIPEPSKWASRRDAAGTSYYQDIADSYTTPPTNLAGTWTTLSSVSTDVHITIGAAP